MTTLTPEQIKEIADQLECGMTCYYNKENNDLLFIPYSDNFDIELDAWEDDLNKLRQNHGKYLTIEPPQSPDSFKIMAQFTDSMPDPGLKDALKRALNGRKPFREFKFTIDNSDDFRQKWFDFKSKKLQEWVKNKLNNFSNEAK